MLIEVEVIHILTSIPGLAYIIKRTSMGKLGFLKSSISKESSSRSATDISVESQLNGSVLDPAPVQTQPPQESASVNQGDTYDPFALPESIQATSSIITPSETLAPVLPFSESLPAAPDAPIILTWEASEETEPTANTSERQFDNEPLEEPPSYEIARIPEHSVTYTFSGLGRTTSTGLLLPPADSPETRPLYYISVCNDFMMPNCLITSLFRGSNGDGQYVGGFTTVLSVYSYPERPKALSALQTVTIAKQELPTHRLLDVSSMHNAYVLKWRIRQSSKGLLWTCPGWPTPSSGIIECTHGLSPKVILAKYKPNKRLPQRLSIPPEALLTVTPNGHKYLDDIVLSLLLVERERLAFA